MSIFLTHPATSAVSDPANADQSAAADANQVATDPVDQPATTVAVEHGIAQPLAGLDSDVVNQGMAHADAVLAEAGLSMEPVATNPALEPGVTIGDSAEPTLAKNYFLLTCNGRQRLVNAVTLAVAQRFVRPEVEVSVASSEDVIALHVPGKELERAGTFEGKGKLYVAKTGDTSVLVRSASAAAVKAFKSYEVTGEALAAEELLEALDSGLKVEIAPLPKPRSLKKDAGDQQSEGDQA